MCYSEVTEIILAIGDMDADSGYISINGDNVPWILMNVE